MHLYYNDVNEAFLGLVAGFENGSISTYRVPSRVGEVMVVDEPVIITYQNPTYRVLFNSERDANPFFHLYESLWMLAGKNDVESLAIYNSKIADIASDDGRTFNGAYGYRWRSHWVEDYPSSGRESRDVDQLNLLVSHLKANPTSRRAVLQMWNVENDLLKIDASKDVCCNTHIYFAIKDDHLDMTVCNRSNDLIWGALGANVVHMSFLQEYVAARIGVAVGVYNQITNNLHAYTECWEGKKWLGEYNRTMHSPPQVDYNKLNLVSLVKDPIAFEEDLQRCVYGWGPYQNNDDDLAIPRATEPFINDVADPMLAAYHSHKERCYIEALEGMEAVKADDWRIAGEQWLRKRKNAWESAERIKRTVQ